VWILRHIGTLQAAQAEGGPMNTRDEVVARWEARLAEWGELGIRVDGKSIAQQVIADLREMGDAYDMVALSLKGAAEESGYSAGHLGREVKAGRIPNAGRENAPKILRRDLPKKPSVLRIEAMDTTVDRKRIALAVANSDRRTSNGS
jgi:hypothetical protein